MIPLEYEIDHLKNIFLEMVELVRDQLTLSKDALLKQDLDTASEVMRKESRVNSYELTIDRECEDFLALHSPFATDLRMVIAILKMSGSLERIGDHAYGISVFVYDEKLKLSRDIVELVKLEALFNDIDEMFATITKAFRNGDVSKAKMVFKKDKIIDRINKRLPRLLQDYTKEKKEKVSNLILLARIVGKLERSGDLIKNMAEEIIFYLESDVIKHKKRNKKISKRFNLPVIEGESEKEIK